MFKINSPIRCVAKREDCYEIFLTREFIKIEINQNVFDFIQHLQLHKVFDLGIVSNYLSQNDITNNSDYVDLFQFLIKNKAIVRI